MKDGSCLCGAVTFEVSCELGAPDACHCVQCRKQSGHFWASTDVPKDALKINGNEFLKWYPSSDRVRRGFCSVCGSSLFWDSIKSEQIGISMGAFDSLTDASLAIHIFVAEKGDYYEITDGLPQNQH